MKYYEIIGQNPKKFPMRPCEYKIYNDLGWGEYDMNKGIEIKDWDNRNTIYLTMNSGFLVDFMEFSPFIIISEKLKNLLENIPLEGVQYFPINLEEKDNPSNKIGGYYVVNILNFEPHDVINQNLSKKDPWTYFYIGLHSSKLTGYDMLRIKDYNETYFISERVKEIIDKSCKHVVKFSEIRQS